MAFTSDDTNLTANGTDFTPPTNLQAWESDPEPVPANIFIRDLTTATTSLVSATPSGLQSDGVAANPVFSPDGSELAFTSSATDLTNNPLDPTPPAGEPGTLGLRQEPRAAQGARAARERRAAREDRREPRHGSLGREWLSHLANNVFLRDLSTGITTLVSGTPSGLMSSGSALQIQFSPDGNLLAYTSDATDLTSNPLEVTPPAIPGESSTDRLPRSVSDQQRFRLQSDDTKHDAHLSDDQRPALDRECVLDAI